MKTALEQASLPDRTTARLFLRQRTVADAEDIFTYVSLPEVAHPAGFPTVDNLEDEIYYLQQIYPQNLAKENLPSGWGITLKGQDRVIGSMDFNHRHGEKVFEVGYTLHPDYWGQGYVPEALTELLTIGFSDYQLDKIVIKCFEDNHQSRRVAEKLGFELISSDEKVTTPTGEECYNLTYELTKERWQEG